MAQCMKKCLPLNREDLSSNPQNPCESQVQQWDGKLRWCVSAGPAYTVSKKGTHVKQGSVSHACPHRHMHTSFKGNYEKKCILRGNESKPSTNDEWPNQKEMVYRTNREVLKEVKRCSSSRSQRHIQESYFEISFYPSWNGWDKKTKNTHIGEGSGE